MRYVARNRPFVVRKAANTWSSHKKWNSNYLREILRETNVNVAITPHGNADSILHLPPNGAVFVKPLERSEPFSQAMDRIKTQALDPTYSGPTHYLQTQNDNLRGEYATLFEDVPPSIPWARIALEKDPDAINFWLGNAASTTALHKDNYENVYVQVLGRKHFVLLPPVEAPCVNEKAVLAATYAYTGAHTDAGVLKKDDLVVQIDEPEEGEQQGTYVPFATWDPDEPDAHATPYSQHSRPLRVSLEEGDMLYLPALWYHKVSQSCNDEGLCCAVNYWYDLDFSGGFWAANSFVRGVGLLEQQQRQASVAAKPYPASLAGKDANASMDRWVREFQQGVGLREREGSQTQTQITDKAQPSFDTDGDGPGAWSTAEKSRAFDRWVDEWQQQALGQTPESAPAPPSAYPQRSSEAQVPQPIANAEKNSTTESWMKQWTAAQR